MFMFICGCPTASGVVASVWEMFDRAEDGQRWMEVWVGGCITLQSRVVPSC